jgi:hypothetical protein
MTFVLQLLRGPALIVIALIIFLAGILVVAAFAALAAQMGLLLKAGRLNNIGRVQFPQNSWGNHSSFQTDSFVRPASASRLNPSLKMPVDVKDFEVVDAVWWQESK